MTKTGSQPSSTNKKSRSQSPKQELGAFLVCRMKKGVEALASSPQAVEELQTAAVADAASRLVIGFYVSGSDGGIEGGALKALGSAMGWWKSRGRKADPTRQRRDILWHELALPGDRIEAVAQAIREAKSALASRESTEEWTRACVSAGRDQSVKPRTLSTPAAAMVGFFAEWARSSAEPAAWLKSRIRGKPPTVLERRQKISEALAQVTRAVEMLVDLDLAAAPREEVTSVCRESRRASSFLHASIRRITSRILTEAGEQDTLRPPGPVRMAIANQLKTLRIARGLSQRALGKLSAIPHTQISKYEGGVIPEDASLARLAKALGVKPEELVPRRD